MPPNTNDDPLSGDQGTAGPVGANGEPGAATPQAGTPGITQDQLNETIREFGSNLGTELRPFIERMQAIEQRLGSGGQPDNAAGANQGGSPAVGAGEASAVEALLADPNAAIDERVLAMMNAHMGPMLQVQADSSYNSAVANLRAEFDNTYGAGKFDEAILPGITSALNAVDKQQQGSSTIYKLSPERLGHIVDGIKGRQIKELNTWEAEHTKTKEASVAANPPTVPLIGGNGVVVQRNPSLSPDDKDFIADYNAATGRSIDRDTVVAVRDAKTVTPGVGSSWNVDDMPESVVSKAFRDSITPK